MRSRSAACSWPKIVTKFLTVDALVNDRVDLPVEEHPVDVVIALAVGAGGERAIGRDVDHVRARRTQLVGQHVAGDVGARQQEPLALEWPELPQRLDERSARNSPGIKSTRMPYRCSREAVDGPIVHSFTPLRSRTSPRASSRCMK